MNNRNNKNFISPIKEKNEKEKVIYFVVIVKRKIKVILKKIEVLIIQLK